MCRKWGQRPSQHTVSVATTSDFLDFLDFSDIQLFVSYSGHREKMMHLSPTLQWDREKCEGWSPPQDPRFLYSAHFRFNWKAFTHVNTEFTIASTINQASAITSIINRWKSIQLSAQKTADDVCCVHPAGLHHPWLKGCLNDWNSGFTARNVDYCRNY